MVRRLSTLAVFAGFVLLAGATPALAHGASGRLDLPVPVSMFAAGVAAILVGAFIRVTATPNGRGHQEAPQGKLHDGPWVNRSFVALRALGLVAFALVVFAGLFDGNDGLQNIAPVTVWVGLALAIPFLSAVAGDIWLPMNPFRTLAGWLNGRRPERFDLAQRVGMWPATAALVVFAWLQLVYPDATDPITVGAATLIYTAWIIGVTRWAGLTSGFEIGGAFHHYNGLISGIAPIRLDKPASVGATSVPGTSSSPAAIRHDGWLRGLRDTPIRPGLVGFVVAMVGVVVYDGTSATDWWNDVWGDTAGTEWFGTIALVATVGALYGVYLLVCRITGRLAESEVPAPAIAAAFAPVLVPIALGFSVAHYFTRIVFEGQQLLHAASDPFGYGWNLLGTANWRVEFWLSATAVWYIQIAVILAAHLVAVVLTHDRALSQFGSKHVVRSQYAMLVLIVVFSSVGLFVLAG